MSISIILRICHDFYVLYEYFLIHFYESFGQFGTRFSKDILRQFLEDDSGFLTLILLLIVIYVHLNARFKIGKNYVIWDFMSTYEFVKKKNEGLDKNQFVLIQRSQNSNFFEENSLDLYFELVLFLWTL